VSELTLTLIKVGFLALLWMFVLSSVSVIRSDMFGERVDPQRGAAAPKSSKPSKPSKRAQKKKRGAPTQLVISEGANAVERYWTGHTVRANRFSTARASERYLEWRFREYPLFREFSGLWGEHDGEVILDYGCGPGNDLTGFALHTRARRIIGMDVSPVSLALATRRLALHDQATGRFELVQVSDSDSRIPLADDSVDHVNCQGVLHHTSHPDEVLAELARVLRPGGTATIMVYNRDSIWLHLCTAYERMVVEGAFPGSDVEEAFRRNTDGPRCPISRAYRSDDFLALCERAGFAGEFAGGYFLEEELEWLNQHGNAALASPQLAAEHKEFLTELINDEYGYPMSDENGNPVTAPSNEYGWGRRNTNPLDPSNPVAKEGLQRLKTAAKPGAPAIPTRSRRRGSPSERAPPASRSTCAAIAGTSRTTTSRACARRCVAS